MTMRVCVESGCPTLTTKTRCPEHARAHDRARGTATERGYGTVHKKLRAEWKRRMEHGEMVVCWRCREERGVVHFVDPDCFDLGHDDNDRSIYRGPECREGNRATASRQKSRQQGLSADPPRVGSTTPLRGTPTGGLSVTADEVSRNFSYQSTSTAGG